jgi:DNA-binding response OmpR family regulator
MFKILVVEKQPQLVQAMEELFPPAEFQIAHVTDAFEASRLVNNTVYDVILLDRGIPRASVFEICKQGRARSVEAAIFILNAQRSGLEEELAVSYGADQCLEHPVQIRDLSARVRAILRRRTRAQPEGQISFQHLMLDINLGIVYSKSVPLNLRPMEFVLLKFFMENPGKVFSCEDLWSRVWQRTGTPSESVRAHIAMLRKKIADPGNSSSLKTVIGRGYKLQAS